MGASPLPHMTEEPTMKLITMTIRILAGATLLLMICAACTAQPIE